MDPKPAILRGVIRGASIQLDRQPNLPDGQAVEVTVHPAPAGEGLRNAFGSWNDAEAIDDFLNQIRADRKQSRAE